MRPLHAVACAALLALCSPAAAQQQPDTSASDLRCAAWAAYIAGVAKDDNADARAALGMALVWFIGRYEAATRTPIEQALTPEYVASIEPQMEDIHKECLPRMQEMGDRLSKFGEKLQGAAQG